MATKTASKSRANKSVKLRKPNVGLVREKNPEKHVATGKYKFFFCFFALTTILFAAISIWLFIFSSSVLEKWENLEKCIKNGTCTTQKTYEDEENVVYEYVNEDGERVVYEYVTEDGARIRTYTVE